MTKAFIPATGSAKLAPKQEVKVTKHTVQLPDSVYERLKIEASDAGQSLDDVILAAIISHIEDMEDLQAVAEYEQRRKNGTLETIPFEKLSAELGLDD